MLSKDDRGTLNSTDSRKATVRKTARGIVAAVFALAVLAAPLIVAAQVDVGLEYAAATGLGTTDIRLMAARVIQIALGLLGIIAVALLIYAGFLWMTAGGNEQRLEQAKAIIKNAIIGLIIILTAFAIVTFIIRAIFGATGGGGIFGGGASSPLQSLYCRGCGPEQLGNGIIEYHYPEVGQTGVARNTKIAITFKKPLKLSSVLKNYCDNDTFEVGDDKICAGGCGENGVVPADCVVPACADKTNENACRLTEYCGWSLVAGVAQCVIAPRLNADNLKIVPQAALGEAGGGAADAAFDQRYGVPEALTDPAPYAAVTVMSEPFDPGAALQQTIVIKPYNFLGDAAVEVNYRVGLRGGLNGIRVWRPSLADPTKPEAGPAFGARRADGGYDATYRADGGYFWSFTTSTTIDVTPPTVTALAPLTVPDPASTEPQYARLTPIFRNQLLQIHFSEAVDPTVTTGLTGAGVGRGFNKIDVKACTGAIPATCQSIVGAWAIGNKYRTVEFTPAEPCDGISKNSCGEDVFCLPKNATLWLVVTPASVSAEPPASAGIMPDGVADMVGNSLDGNANGRSVGPSAASASGTNTDSLGAYRVAPMGEGDTVAYFYRVGDSVDLVPPVVTAAVPTPSGGDGITQDSTFAEKGGPSSFPPNELIKATWSKNLSATAMRTGAETDDYATVSLRAREYRKVSCAEPGDCEYVDDIGPPGYFVSCEPATADPLDGRVCGRLIISHSRPFFTAGDLGWATDDAYDLGLPYYLPILKSALRDDRQNCFYPSNFKPVGDECGASAQGEPPPASCCNRSPQGAFVCTPPAGP